jgi:hypothetical protein
MMTMVPHPHLTLTHIVCPSTCDHDSTSPSRRPHLLCHIHAYSPRMREPSEQHPCSLVCKCVIHQGYLFHTHDILVVATVIIISFCNNCHDHLERVWRWSKMWKMCLQCPQQHRQAWENCGSIAPGAADVVSYREKIITIISRVIQMVALNC